MLSEMGLRAACLISSGAAESGKPCERLTAPCFRARRVISRMTDSVNCSAFAESMRREICAIETSEAVIAPSQNDEMVSVVAQHAAPLQGKIPEYGQFVSARGQWRSAFPHSAVHESSARLRGCARLLPHIPEFPSMA